MLKQDRHLYEFGPFRLDTSERLLLRAGVRVPLTEKAFDTLVALVRRAGRLASKEELMAEVWPDAFVEENNLDKSISAIRQALGEKPSAPEYVETVRGRGYRFVARVSELQGEGPGPTDGRPHARGTAGEAEGPAPVSQMTGARGAAADVAPPVESLARRGLFKSLHLLLGAGLIAVGLGVTVYFWLAGRARQVEKAAAVRSIAVLPFRPLAAYSRDESLELGMADTLIFRLGGLRGLVVRPISAVRKYTDLNQDPLAAGREQQVDAVLDSTLQTVGGKFRVTARLVRVADGSVLWADKFEDKFTDIFAVQDSIAEKVTGALALQLSGEEKHRLTRRYTDNSQAYQLYLRGRYFLNKRTPDGYRKGIEYFQQAIEKDPDYALGYSGLADCYSALGAWQILPPGESNLKARAAAEKALRLDDSLAEAHTSLALVKNLSGDWSGAEAEFRRATELNPNYEAAHRGYGFYLAAVGRLDEAMAETRRALELDPLSLPNNAQLGRIFYLMRRYDEAIAQYQKTLEMDPNFVIAHFQLGWAYEKKEMYDKAIAEYQVTMTLQGQHAAEAGIGGRGGVEARIGRAYALSGRRGEAQKVLDKLREMSKQGFVPPYNMALIYDGLGEEEQVIAWLEKAIDAGGQRFGLKTDPTWDSLRPHPRFQDLLRRAGFEP